MEDITCRLVDGAKDQLIELTLTYREGLGTEARSLTMTADPAKLQTLLYGMQLNNLSRY